MSEWSEQMRQDEMINHYLRGQALKEAKREISVLNHLYSREFLNYLLKHGKGIGMNDVVANHKFLAYDIVKQLLTMQVQLISKKQRKALMNVYIFAKYQVKTEEISND